MRNIEKNIFTIIGSVSLILTVLLTNLIIQDKVRLRQDLTEDKIYTLTDNTKEILSGLDTTVNIQFYYSRFNNNMPVAWKNYARRVDDVLKEFEQNSDRIRVNRLNPEPNSDAEDKAIFDGVKPITTIGLDKLYLGINISCLDKSKNIDSLTPDKEELLEYQLARAIVQVYRGEKPVVGVLSSLPVLGQELTAEMAQRKQKAVPPWIAFYELLQDFRLTKIHPQAMTLPKNMDAIVMIHPPKLSEQMTAEIERFIVKGGNALVYLDPASILAISLKKQKPESSLTGSSNLEKLLDTWGVSYNPNESVADADLARSIVETGVRQSMPTFIDLRNDQINSENVISSKIDHIAMIFSGSFKTNKLSNNLSSETVLNSTSNSQNVSTAEIDLKRDQQKFLAEFKSDETEKKLAVAISGKFPTAFPENNEFEKKSSTVILVGDSDMLFDEVCTKLDPKTQKRSVLNDNISFFQNCVEYLTGSKQLIGIRSRQTKKRPFIVMQKMQAEADLKFKEKLMKKKEELVKANEEFQKLAGASADQKEITTQEQREAQEKVRRTQAAISRDLRKATNELNQDVKRLQNFIKWICIAMMPLLIAIIGSVVALIKNRRCGAK